MSIVARTVAAALSALGVSRIEDAPASSPPVVPQLKTPSPGWSPGIPNDSTRGAFGKSQGWNWLQERKEQFLTLDPKFLNRGERLRRLQASR